ncbi:MAG: hypothetical protein R6U98_10515 [Pirellulaceae bacterium]
MTANTPSVVGSWEAHRCDILGGSGNIFQAVGFVRVESCPTQAVLPLVGLAADKITRHR